jgi:hypothetical protein
MLICNVSLRPKRVAIAADVAEAAAALDISTIGIVFATQIDEPASVGEIIDAYLGEIMLEAASANDTISVGLEYAANVNETITSAEIQDATLVTTTWNPSDKSTNVVLASGNLAASTATNTNEGVRSTSSKASGAKVYFEVSWGNSTGGNNGCGIATASASLTTLASAGTGGAIVYNSGTIYINGTTSGINIGIIQLSTICFAIDLVNNRFWARKGAGNWNNSGTANPATNTGGIDISGLFASTAAFGAATFNSTVGTATVNFGATTFNQTIPSGFSAWG